MKDWYLAGKIEVKKVSVVKSGSGENKMADTTSAKSSREHNLGNAMAMIQALGAGQQAMSEAQQAMRQEVSGALQAIKGETDTMYTAVKTEVQSEINQVKAELEHTEVVTHTWTGIVGQLGDRVLWR